MTDEPTTKRRRLHCPDASDDFLSTFLPTPTVEANGHVFDGIDPFLSPATSWAVDEFAHDPNYLQSQEELRSLLFTTARSGAPTRDATPVGEHEDNVGDRINIKHILVQGRRVQYLKNYISQVAPWLDMFDSNRAFGIQLPALARESPPLLYALLAIGARQLERKEKTQSSFDSLELYQEAIRLLTPILQTRDTHVIATCVVLCCLEMFTASAQDWRRHLEGCAAVFDSFGVNGFSGGISQAVFWCYARMDVCGALIADGTESTLLEPSKWLPPGTADEDAEALFRISSPDMYAHLSVYLSAKTCELISDRNKYVEIGEENGCNAKQFHDRWARLWRRWSEWILHRPKEILPIESIDSSPFPQIFYAHWAAISSNQLYHTSCILLLTSNTQHRALVDPSPETSTHWHVKRVCGISLANPHEGNLNNAIQPLWIAGRLLSHGSEQALVVQTIRHIEALTGWTACWRIRDLEIAWGYKVRGAA